MLAPEPVSFGSKVYCKGCGDDIFSRSRVLVRCAECRDSMAIGSSGLTGLNNSPHMDLCPDCFAGKVEIGGHEASHNYRLVDDGGFVLFNTCGPMTNAASSGPSSDSKKDGSWTVKEQLMLLDTVEAHGFGNWDDIAKSLNAELGANNTNHPLYKNPAAVRDHFNAVFLHGSMGRHLWREEQRGRALDHTGGSSSLSPAVVKSEPTPAGGAAHLTSHESILLGYLPIRDDFEVEWDNEAESLVSHLIHQPPSSSGQAADDDDALEADLKAVHVEMYKSRLRQRERRKKVVRDHSLVSNFFRENPITYDHRGHAMLSAPKQKKQSSSSSSNKDLTTPEAAEKLKLLAEFQTVPEFQAFMANINKEKEIRSRIKDLIRYRKNGVRKLADTAEFEAQLKVRRINKKRNEEGKAAAAAAAAAAMLQGSSPDAASVASPTLASSPMSIKSFELDTGSVQSPRTNNSPVTSTPFSLSAYPGYDILSANEKKLCANLRLTPAHYISYKTCLLTNHLQKKKGLTPKPLQPVGLDKNNRKVIFNFLMRAGWITAY